MTDAPDIAGQRPSPVVAVIGGGPAGLAAAEVLSSGGCQVVVIERMPTLGRKLLMAGRSGLNLTHSEPADLFLARYAEAADWLRPAIDAYPASALVEWAQGLGQACFVGSSGRIFPTAMKASPLLRAWLARLATSGVSFRTRCQWTGWKLGDNGVTLTLEESERETTLQVDACVLALGGASWSRLGSDGAWVKMVQQHGVTMSPFRAANCGVYTSWQSSMRESFAGEPIKGAVLRLGEKSVRGDVVVTQHGMEGGAVYALSAAIRNEIERLGEVTVHLDLRPDMTLPEITRRLSAVRPRESRANRLRKALRLAPVAQALIREAVNDGLAINPAPSDMPALATLIKNVPVRVTGTDDLDRAISVAGGIRKGELNADFMLLSQPGVFAAGEMLDWEAPTGGYLLQACISTGVAAGHGALKWLANRGEEGYRSAS